MGFSRKLQYYLVHHLAWTNKQASTAIKSGLIRINGEVVIENQVVNDTDEIRTEHELLRAGKQHRYFLFYKPRGKESSLNATVADNIREFFADPEHLAIAGRLDKDSEGLMLLSNDGKWVEYMCHPNYEKEKEYIVALDQAPSADFILKFKNGVLLGGNYMTKPCFCEAIGNYQIRVILKEGKNRQIRRMCHKLGYGVERLIRIRINTQTINNLNSGQVIEFTP